MAHSAKHLKKAALKRSLEDNEEPEFQIAPMIDVLLVLLMFFMANITLESRAKIKMELAVASNPNATNKDVNLGEAIINVKIDEATRMVQIFIGEFPTDMNSLPSILESRRNDHLSLNPGGTFRVIIRADKDVEYREVNAVMRQCALANIPNVVFSVVEPKKGGA